MYFTLTNKIHIFFMNDRANKKSVLLDEITTLRERVSALESENKLLENKFRLLFNAALDGVFIINAVGEIIDCSKNLEHLWQYSSEEIIGKNYSYFLNRESKAKNSMLKLLEANKEVDEEIKIIAGDSETMLSLRRKGFPLFTESDHFMGAIVYDRDITESYQPEELRNLLKAALEATANSIVITGFGGDVIWVNPAFTQLTGYDNDEMLYRNISVLKSGKHDKEFYKNMWDTILTGKVWHGEIINKRKDGSLYPEEQTITPVKNKKDEISYFISVKQDITDRKKREEEAKLQLEQLIQADKMVALGTLVSGVAHEINNPNNFIMLNTPLLQKVWDSLLPILDKFYEENGDFSIMNVKYSAMKEKYPKMCQNIMEGSRRIKRIVEDLKRFAQKSSSEIFEPVDVNSVINSSITLLENQIKKSTDKFEVNLAENIPTTIANFQYLEQIVINFIQNSCQALPDKKRGIKVSTLYDEKEGTIEIKIEDEGSGIKEEDMPHITNPFFTTKRDTGGTGLGLSISSKIIKDLGGRLEFSSRVNVGTTARVILPIKQK
jgi:PAS domain S-box-containing protein